MEADPSKIKLAGKAVFDAMQAYRLSTSEALYLLAAAVGTLTDGKAKAIEEFLFILEEVVGTLDKHKGEQ